MAIVIDAPRVKNCGDCIGYYRCKGWTDKPYSCPVIGEIPDKHGRLIDADKLAVAVAEAQDSMLHKEYDPFMLLGDILRWIDLAPTILEATE